MLIRVAKQQLSKLGNLPGNISTFLLMNRNDSSWCSLLDEEDLKVLEYQGDLKNITSIPMGTNSLMRLSALFSPISLKICEISPRITVNFAVYFDLLGQER